MKALSVFQPWAQAIARGMKKIETRSWATRYRGPLLIHAARTKVGGAVATAQPALWRAVLGVPENQSLAAALAALPVGVVVARCELVDCIAAGDTESIRFAARGIGELYSQFEHDLGDYRRGRWAWMLRNIEALPEPVAARGSQGLFELDLEEARSDA